MSEKRVGYWRWLAQGLVGIIKATPDFMKGFKDALLNGTFEIFIGFIGSMFFMVFAAIGVVAIDIKVFLVLCIVPSFLLMLHGIYRQKDDC